MYLVWLPGRTWDLSLTWQQILQLYLPLVPFLMLPICSVLKFDKIHALFPSIYMVWSKRVNPFSEQLRPSPPPFFCSGFGWWAGCSETWENASFEGFSFGVCYQITRLLVTCFNLLNMAKLGPFASKFVGESEERNNFLNYNRAVTISLEEIRWFNKNVTILFYNWTLGYLASINQKT